MNVSAPSVLRFLICAATLMVTSGKAVSQGSTDYTTALPAPETIRTQIKGSDPTDTVARQIAAFRGLENFISNIQYSRSVRGQFTPGEQKMMNAYKQSELQLSQGYTSSHSPEENTAFNRLCGRYQFDQKLYDDYHRLMGQPAEQAFQESEARNAQAVQRAQQRAQGGNNTRSAAPSSAPAGSMDDLYAGVESKFENDPEIRRCLELGGTEDDCAREGVMGVGKSAEVAVGRMVGVDVNAGRPRNGVILVGSYHSRAELPEVTLGSDGMAVLRKCGTLVDENHAYTLRNSGGTTQLLLANEPAPILLTQRPDGTLSGPGQVTVKGQVIAGYRTQTNCPVGTEAMYCTSSSTPVYAPSMQRCVIGQLAPQAPPAPQAKPPGLEAMIASMIDTGPAEVPIYGFRMIGTYAAAAGMKLDFQNRFVTLDCGKAHANAAYSVENTPGGFMVRVQNPVGPLLLTVGPDNTLRGSGSATVNGRLVTGFRGDSANFAPHSETCSVGTFLATAKAN